MNDKNEWNHTENIEKSEFSGSGTEQTPYTTPDGGNGMHYHASRTHGDWEGSYRAADGRQGEEAEVRRARRGARVSAVLIVVLCIALGFSTGMLGSKLVGYMASEADGVYESPDRTTGDSPKFSTEAEGTASGDRTEQSGSSEGRNPTPTLDKSDSLGQLTWSGSAGKDAYPTLAQAIDSVATTVVEISTETVVGGGWLGNYVSSGAGSGVVISSDGYIVTNNHVIEGADTISVRTSDGTVYTAALIGRDAASDIAVLWVDTKGLALPRAQLGCSADLVVGETVFAIGNPLGSLGGTVTDGIISATARSIAISGQNMTLLQTNAAVNPGNSGGGLFNMAGQLIGVVNAKCSQDDVEGLGFAIPVDTAYEVIDQLIRYGYVRGVVDAGLSLYDVTSSNILSAWRYFNSQYAGVYILESAYTTELMYGDLLYSVDGIRVTTSADVEAILAQYEVGDSITLTVIRGEKEHKVALTLQEYVPSDRNVQFTQK